MRRARWPPLLAVLLVLGAPTAGDASAGVDRPAVDVPSAILVDAATGDVLIAKAPSERRPIASATKLMTALLALEDARPGEVFRAPRYRAIAAESQIGLAEGERMTVSDLLSALLLESANDAAATLAAGVSGSSSGFVDRMNRRARELGLRDTHYANPIGLDDPANYSTARDLGSLARVLLRDRRFASIVRRPRAVLSSGDRRRIVENRNTLVGRPHVDGVKTGYTAGAGYVLVGSASARGAQVVSVVLDAPSEGARDSASRELLEYGLDQFRRRTVLAAGRPIARAPVTGRDAEAALASARDVKLTVRRGAGEVRTRVMAPGEVRGPLDPGQRIGSVDVVYDGKVAESAALITADAVPGPSTVSRVTSALDAPLTWIAVIAIVFASAVGLVRHRSAAPGRRSTE